MSAVRISGSAGNPRLESQATIPTKPELRTATSSTVCFEGPRSKRLRRSHGASRTRIATTPPNPLRQGDPRRAKTGLECPFLRPPRGFPRKSGRASPPSTASISTRESTDQATKALHFRGTRAFSVSAFGRPENAETRTIHSDHSGSSSEHTEGAISASKRLRSAMLRCSEKVLLQRILAAFPARRTLAGPRAAAFQAEVTTSADTGRSRSPGLGRPSSHRGSRRGPPP